MIIFCYLLLAFLLVGLCVTSAYRHATRKNSSPIDKQDDTSSGVILLRMYLIIYTVESLQTPYLFRYFADNCRFPNREIAFLYAINFILPSITAHFLYFMCFKFRVPKLAFGILLILSISFSLYLRLSQTFLHQVFAQFIGLSGIKSWQKMILAEKELQNDGMDSLNASRISRKENTSKPNLLKMLQNWSMIHVSTTLVALISGVLCDVFSEWLDYRAISPFYICVPFLALACLEFLCSLKRFNSFLSIPISDSLSFISSHTWKFINFTVRDVIVECKNIFLMADGGKVMFVLFVQAFMEAGIYILAFAVTPLLEFDISIDHHSSYTSIRYLPLGAIYATNTAASKLGEILFDLFTQNSGVPSLVNFLTCTSTMFVSWSLWKLSSSSLDYPKITLCLIVLLSILHGIYSCCNQWLRKFSYPIEQTSRQCTELISNTLIRAPILIILVLISIDLTPSSELTSAININTTSNQVINSFSFHYLNPSKLFFLMSILSCFASTISILLHLIAKNEMRYTGCRYRPPESNSMIGIFS